MTTSSKIFVLDTNVLISAGKQPLAAFAEHLVILPMVVLSELEAHRNDPDTGFTARSALRALEELRVEHGSDLGSGVVVNDEGGMLRIETNHVSRANLPESMKAKTDNDTRILAVAKNLQDEDPDREVILVSLDLPMRLIAESVLGIRSEEYRHNNAPDTGYTGVSQMTISHDEMQEFYSDKSLDIVHDQPVNTGLVLSCDRSTAIGVVRPDKSIGLIADREVFGVRGASMEQKLALQHLLDPEIGIVSLGGPAGTGKTMLALAAGLEQTLESRTYKRVVVFRNLYAVGGQDLGFLPGSEAEKMNPWAAAVYDALEAFCEPNVIDEVKSRNLIEVLPLTHIRGRTFTDTWMLVDEAQNLERSVVLTALSRVGQGSKVTLSWDHSQRDNLRVGRFDGIHSVVEKLKGEPLFAHVTLQKSMRSKTAELVTRMLDEME